LTGAAVNPDLVGFSLATTIRMAAGSTSDDKTAALSQAVSAAADCIRNMDFL
jgi:hypothetical protein